MEGDLGFGAEFLAEGFLDFFGDVVGLFEGDFGIEHEMAFHYDAGSLSSGLKLVEVNDSWDGLGGLFDLGLDVVRKRHVQQFLDGGNRHLHGHHEYEHADYASGDRVKDDELVSKEYGAGDSEQRADGRERVGTVMPGVGDHHRAVQRLALDDGVAVKNLFRNNRCYGRPEGDHSR